MLSRLVPCRDSRGIERYIKLRLQGVWSIRQSKELCRAPSARLIPLSRHLALWPPPPWCRCNFSTIESGRTLEGDAVGASIQ